MQRFSTVITFIILTGKPSFVSEADFEASFRFAIVHSFAMSCSCVTSVLGSKQSKPGRRLFCAACRAPPDRRNSRLGRQSEEVFGPAQGEILPVTPEVELQVISQELQALWRVLVFIVFAPTRLKVAAPDLHKVLIKLKFLLDEMRVVLFLLPSILEFSHNHRRLVIQTCLARQYASQLLSIKDCSSSASSVSSASPGNLRVTRLFRDASTKFVRRLQMLDARVVMVLHQIATVGTADSPETI